MSVQPVIRLMEQLKELHEGLLELSKKKTNLLKQNDMDELQKLVVQERKHIQAISQTERQRAEAVHVWYQDRQLSELDPTISDMLPHLEAEEREQLNARYEALIYTLADLKQQEKLNAELTKQSLQFINLSLDLLQPSIDQVNYGSKTDSVPSNRSVFDSKA